MAPEEKKAQKVLIHPPPIDIGNKSPMDHIIYKAAHTLQSHKRSKCQRIVSIKESNVYNFLQTLPNNSHYILNYSYFTNSQNIPTRIT